MAIVISRDVALTDSSTEDPNAGHIGYQNLVAPANVSADSEQAFFPVVNLTNPATNIFWWSNSLDEQFLNITPGLNAGVDYIAFANHNFGSGGIAYQVQASNDNVTWDDIGDELIPENDTPHMQIFPLSVYLFWRVRLAPTTAVPRIAVMYLGKVLVLQRRIYVGHIPITMGDNTTVSNNRSEKGQFLGRVVRREYAETSIDLKNLTADWVRSYLLDFIEQAKVLPFFWAWRPIDYPREVGYCWTTDDINPKNQRPNGMMQVQIKVQGIGKFAALAVVESPEIST